MGFKWKAFRLLLWKNVVSEVYGWPWFVFEVFCLLLSSIMIVISPSLFGNDYAKATEAETVAYRRNLSSIYRLYEQR